MAKAKKLLDLAAEGGEQLAKEIRDLLFVHNTDAQKLARQQAMGGMPNPSIAVTQRDIPFEGFGDISLIGRPESFDPSLRQNPLFSADAYTVRAPSPVRVANKNAYKQFKSDYEAYRGSGNIDDVAYSLGDLESKSRIEPSDFRRVNDFLEYDNAAKLKFARDNNIPVPKKENGDIDYYALRDVKSENADKYEQWRQGEISKYFQPEEYFVTNPDYDRYSGRAKLQPYTAENVSKWMSKRAGAGQESTMTFGAGNVRASTTERIKSLEQARQMKGQLKPAEDMAEFKQTSDMILGDLQDALKDYYQYDTSSFSYFDSVGEMIALSEKKGIKRAMEEVGFKDVPDELVREIEGYKDYLRSAPTEYFESKPNRPVNLREFGGAIVPEGTPQGLIDQLQREGLQVEKYTDEADRVAKRGAFENLMFTRPETVVGAGLLGAGVLGAMTPQKVEAGALSAGTKSMKKIAKKAMAGDMKAEEQLKEAIRAYHGSPYDFEQFMLENIGTGEGAQAYGWGLYFAEAEDVAKTYKQAPQVLEGFDNFAMSKDADSYLYDLSESLIKSDPLLSDAISELRYGDFPPDVIKRKMRDFDDDYTPEEIEAAIGRFDDVLKDIDEKFSGKMYEVAIKARLDDLLDWDKPLSQQSDSLKEKLLNLSEEYPDLLDKDSIDVLKGIEKTGFRAGWGDLRGIDLYNLLSEKLSRYPNTDFGDPRSPEAASRILDQYGIKGIRYDDGLSRGKEGGTSNYVVFDPRIIEIARKYGVALPVAASMLTAGLAPQEAQAGGLGLLDNLLKAGYPESVAKRIASGELPMDYASRMQRASEQGYDLTPYYSGYDAIRGVKDDRLGNQPITDVTESLWASDNPLIAGTYAASLGGGNIHPLLMRSPEAVIDAKGNQWQNLLGIDVTPESYSRQLSTNSFARSAEESGANVAEIQNVVDYGNKAGKMKNLYPDFEDLTKAGSNVRIDLSGENTRSLLSAAFDPEYTGSNILGSRVIPTTAAGLLAAGAMAPEDAEAATGYKLFRQVDGKLYPLFVNRSTEVPMGEWLKAEAGELTPEGKVKSSLGPLAYRPGWHAGDLPIATHIGGKSGPVKAPNYRPNDQVWAEVEFPEGVDWQAIANANATRNKAGEIIPRTAQITDQVPYGGFYRYKTNPNMTGEWMIGGDMKVNRVLSDEEVQAINEASGVADLPRLQSIKDKTMLATPIAGAGLMAALAPDQVQAQELDPNLPLTIGSPKQEVNYQTMPSYYDYGDGATIPVRPPEPIRETKPEYLPAGMPVNPYTFMMSQGATQGEASRTLADAYSEIARGAANAIGGFGGEMETLGKGLLFAITGGPMGGTPFSRFMGVLGNYNPQLPNTQDVSEIPALLPNFSPMTEEERRMYRTAGEFLSPL